MAEGKWVRQDGWMHSGNNQWVHVGCKKLSRANYNRNIRREIQKALNWDDYIIDEVYYLLGDEDEDEANE
jgi:hypothetical protein